MTREEALAEAIGFAREAGGSPSTDPVALGQLWVEIAKLLSDPTPFRTPRGALISSIGRSETIRQCATLAGIAPEGIAELVVDDLKASGVTFQS